MGQQADRIAATTAERGIPEPWDAFGSCMDANAGYVNRITAALEVARKDLVEGSGSESALEAVTVAFEQARDNLNRASLLVSTALVELDDDGGWAELDRKAALLDLDDVSGPGWGRPRYNHPFSVFQESLRFNWGYMREHGVRAFYEMTLVYLDDLRANLDTWHGAWSEELVTGVVDRLTMLDSELIGLEAPMHCGICKKTIMALLYLDA